MHPAAASDATAQGRVRTLMEAYTVPTVSEIIVRMRDAVSEGGGSLAAELWNLCDLTHDLPMTWPPAAQNGTLARQLDNTRWNAVGLSNYVLSDIRVCVAASLGQNVPRPVQGTDPPSGPAQGRGRPPGSRMRGRAVRSYIMAAEPG